MAGCRATYSVEGSRQEANVREERREWRASARHSTTNLNDPTEQLLPPGCAAHEGRSSPKCSTEHRQLESHGAVLSNDVDSSWAQD
jgi:hypothetical protein